MKQGLATLLYNFAKRFMGWTLHMIMCVLLCYLVSIHMSQLLSTGRPISSSVFFWGGGLAAGTEPVKKGCKSDKPCDLSPLDSQFCHMIPCEDKL